MSNNCTKYGPTECDDLRAEVALLREDKRQDGEAIGRAAAECATFRARITELEAEHIGMREQVRKAEAEAAAEGIACAGFEAHVAELEEDQNCILSDLASLADRIGGPKANPLEADSHISSKPLVTAGWIQNELRAIIEARTTATWRSWGTKKKLDELRARVAELEGGWNTLGQRIIDVANEWVFDAENNGCGPAYSQLALKLRAALAAPTGEADTKRVYPCYKCGIVRTEAEGGRIFTACDDCWNGDTESEG